MFRNTDLRYAILAVIALGSAACSNQDIRDSRPVNQLPPIPISEPPQPRVQPPAPARSQYETPAFEEYKPQSYSEPQYDDTYAPEKDYQDAYTSTIEPDAPVVVETLKPEPLVAVEPEPAPVVTAADLAAERRKSELDIDPFASVPDREVLTATRPNKSTAEPAPARATKPLSAAANALLLSAKAEAAVGRQDAAINKVERALRIEPQSPELWYQLASLNYDKGIYDQAISLARKALPLASGNRDLTEKSLDLMNRAATKTGNTRVFKEVLDYKKMNL
jgi:predicted Zn-dependent protease